MICIWCIECKCYVHGDRNRVCWTYPLVHVVFNMRLVPIKSSNYQKASLFRRPLDVICCVPPNTSPYHDRLRRIRAHSLPTRARPPANTELCHSYPCPCPNQFVEHLRTANGYGYSMKFVELFWAGVWVWISQLKYHRAPCFKSRCGTAGSIAIRRNDFATSRKFTKGGLIKGV